MKIVLGNKLLISNYTLQHKKNPEIDLLSSLSPPSQHQNNHKFEELLLLNSKQNDFVPWKILKDSLNCRSMPLLGSRSRAILDTRPKAKDISGLNPVDMYTKEPTARWYISLSHITEFLNAFNKNEFSSAGVDIGLTIFNMIKI